MGTLLLLLLVVSGSSLLPLWALPKWLAEINSNLVTYYIPFQLLGVVVALLCRRALGVRYALMLAGLLGVVSFLQLRPVVRCYTAEVRKLAPDAARFIVVSADLAGISAELTELAAQLQGESQPSVVGLSGVTPQIAAELANVFPSYAVVQSVPRDDGFGLALLARGVAVEPRFETLGESFEELPPVLGATVRLGSSATVELMLLRLPVPISPRARQISDIIIRRITVPLRYRESSFIIFGNYHLTPTSKLYQRTLWATKASSAMEGFGYLRSCCFPAPWLRFPVNHLLYGGALESEDFKVLSPGRGRIAPVQATFALPRKIGGGAEVHRR